MSIPSDKIPSLAECLAAADETKCMITQDNAIAEIPGILKKHFEHDVIFLVADNNTFKAAGEQVEKSLKTAGVAVCGSYIFNEAIHAEYRHVETIRAILEEHCKKNKGLVPAAVGSGTINDLVKRAASELKLPYLCIPTAASMDGYTANGAALLYDDYKQTMICEAPRAIAADPGILAEAPAYLSSSGFGDLAGKIIAGGDWIIADKLFAVSLGIDGKGELAAGLDPIEQTAWAMVQNPLHVNLEKSKNAVRGDREAVKTLFEGLGITGFALQYMKDSRPASGCEHMFSHVWEMENLSVDGIAVTHGHKVVMGTLAASAFFDCFFAEKPKLCKDIPSWTEREAQIRSVFSDMGKALPAVIKSSREKFIEDTNKLMKLREGILDNWDDIKNAVYNRIPSYAKIRTILKEGGAPLSPKELGLSRLRVIESAKKAHMIRKRFTVLDLAYISGAFDRVLKQMEDSAFITD